MANRELPVWVRSAPRSVRQYIVQEYYVDEKVAHFFAKHARSYEDIIHLRKMVHYHSLPKHATLADAEFHLIIPKGVSSNE